MVVIAASVAFSASGAAASPHRTTVPIEIVNATRDGGAQPMVRVEVGNTSSPVPAILDTGSSGLQIFADAVSSGPGSGVKVTSTRSGITYAGGHRFVGLVADATVTIGAQRTRQRIPVSLVYAAFCVPSKPTCPARDGIAGFERDGVFGILGIGLATSKGPVASPILGMAKPLAESWSIHLHDRSGTLVLGAAVPSPSQRVATIAMRRTGSWEGRALWADSAVDLCTTVGTVAACTRSLFDTGTAAVQLHGPEFEAVPATGQRVNAGTPVMVALPSAPRPFWSFTAGNTRSVNLVVRRDAGRAFVNWGVQPYFDFRITYDDTKGLVLLDTQRGH